jgi:carboxymethylenebutenolidase
MADIDITSPDGHTFAAHRADPEGEPTGGIVVIQEIFGVNRHIRSVADRFAEAGYLAIAPALFDRLERGVELDYDGAGTSRGRELAWERGSIDLALTDLEATAALLDLELAGTGGVASVGFCFGGMLSCAMASRRPDHLSAAVAYYPSRAAQLLPDDHPQVPLQIHLGDEDQGVTVADGQALAGRWPDAEIHRYATAGHGFNCDLRASYDPAAAAEAWQHTLRFIADHGGHGDGEAV